MQECALNFVRWQCVKLRRFHFLEGESTRNVYNQLCIKIYTSNLKRCGLQRLVIFRCFDFTHFVLFWHLINFSCRRGYNLCELCGVVDHHVFRGKREITRSVKKDCVKLGNYCFDTLVIANRHLRFLYWMKCWNVFVCMIHLKWLMQVKWEIICGEFNENHIIFKAQKKKLYFEYLCALLIS